MAQLELFYFLAAERRHDEAETLAARIGIKLAEVLGGQMMRR